MKIPQITLFLTCLLTFFSLSAQWSTNSLGINYNAGNVGIGTINPVSTLSVLENSNVAGYGNFPTVEINNPNLAGDAYSALLLKSGNASSVISINGAIGELFSHSFDNSSDRYIWLRTLGSSYPLYLGYNKSDLTISSSNVGIGTATPQTKLDVSGSIKSLSYLSGITSPSDNFTYDGKSLNHYSLSWVMDSWATSPTAWLSAYGGFKFFTKGLPRMAINYDGSILIGKTTGVAGTHYLLDVAGDVRANKLVVNATGADYVFDSSYKLMSLQDVEKFIKQNHHLPQIYSAEEMKNNGVDISDNQIKMLQKTEELTLYIIQQNKIIGQQGKLIESQEIKMNAQQAQLNTLRTEMDVLTNTIRELNNK